MIVASDSAAWAGERVGERVVVNHWLAAETRKRTVATSQAGATATSEGETLDTETDALDDDEALDALLRRKPGAAAFLWRERPVEWIRTELSQREFERLRFVEGPDELGWRALAPSGRVVDGAERIAASDRANLEAETDVEIERVCSMAESLADRDRIGAFVLARRGRGPPTIVDGNHRATAVALHLHRTGEYQPQRAFLGTATNPVLSPLWQRLRAAAARLRPGGPRW